LLTRSRSADFSVRSSLLVTIQFSNFLTRSLCFVSLGHSCDGCSVQPVTSGAGDRIYLNKIVTGKGERTFFDGEGARNFFYRCLLKFGSRSNIKFSD
jgi:hypothetical protein